MILRASSAEGSGRDGMRGRGAFRRLGRARRGCRAFNVSPEGVAAISYPKACDVGPAVSVYIGRRAIHLSIQSAGRLLAGYPGWMPRGGATSPRRRRAPFTLGQSIRRFLPAEVPGGDVLGRRHPSIPLRRQPGSDTTQGFADPFGPAAPSIFGFAHGFNHGASRDREAVNLCRG